jgi:pilus assembly protein TadC
MQRLLDRYRELSGIYGFGFDKASFLGVTLPLIIVVVIGGAGAWLVSH